jgi:S-DNA-T family DNA segregation ATPase FtsK/SpoIIIE
MRTVLWDPVVGAPHLVAYGDVRSGKTNLLQSLLTQLAETWPTTGVNPEHVAGPPGTGRTNEVIVVDFRRRLVMPPADGRWSYAGSAPVAAELCSSLAERLSRDSDDRAMRPSFVIVDDYDLVATAAGNPLHVLLPLLPRSADLNVHLILTRRIGGAARAQFEPVLQALTDAGTPVLLFSGPSTEGRLAHGVAPRPLPPGRAMLTTRDLAPQLVQTPVMSADRPRPAPIE